MPKVLRSKSKLGSPAATLLPAEVLARKNDAANPFAKQNVEFNAKADGDEVTLTIYDEIGGWGVSARDVSAALNDGVYKRVHVRLNSPGGDVFAGFAIYNLLREYGAKVIVTVDGLAASAASIIAMAGNEVRMGDGAFMMIHNAWALGVGDHAEMLSLSKTLKKIDGELAKIYSKRTEIEESAIAKMMAAETWLTADEAIAQGFADKKTKENTKAKASFDLSAYKNAPMDTFKGDTTDATIEFDASLVDDLIAAMRI